MLLVIAGRPESSGALLCQGSPPDPFRPVHSDVVKRLRLLKVFHIRQLFLRLADVLDSGRHHIFGLEDSMMHLRHNCWC